MGIYVKGMDMPKGCAFCKIKKHNGKKMICPFCDEEWDIRDPMSADHRLENCPLVDVPPHTRLIDANALMNEFKILQSGREIFGMEFDSSFLDSSQEISTEWYRVEETLEDAPTIIEAEEGDT